MRREGAALLGRLWPHRSSRAALGQDQTEWVLAAFPLGGYVKMLDEREGEVAAARTGPRAFNRQPVAQALRHRPRRPARQLSARHRSCTGCCSCTACRARVPVRRRSASRHARGCRPLWPRRNHRRDRRASPVRTWEEVRWLLLLSTRWPGTACRSRSAQRRGRRSRSTGSICPARAADRSDSDFLDAVGLQPLKCGPAGDRDSRRRRVPPSAPACRRATAFWPSTATADHELGAVGEGDPRQARRAA